MTPTTPKRLLIAASGTGGHLFPALAVAEALSDYEITWLGVPDRLEVTLIPPHYPLKTVAIGGMQQGLGLSTLGLLGRMTLAMLQVRRWLKQGHFCGVFTTGGYIAAPAILAARSLGLPVILHESNAIPGKVTTWLSRWCTVTAIGFAQAAARLPQARTMTVGTPVRSQFFQSTQAPLPLAVPDTAPLLVVVGGSQGAVAVNQLVRQCAPTWLEAGIWIVHLTGEHDPDRWALQHPHYLALPFWEQMASLLTRANLVISRAGAGSLTELAITGTPSILIPYPYAAEDHQTYNAQIFADAGAALWLPQSQLTPELLREKVLSLLQAEGALAQMAKRAQAIAVPDSAQQVANLIRQLSDPSGILG
ncbi:undecaprenyldiphospho-muramoylpentapeptide beta-N-acetylglucosaminyltransferase [Trichothermofontia sichuanensis B231]|uniref:undecaprenyldiphospho-muramoylpentapeptide beta-N-acetylglucosaminyltransferase n=1 Tax=Trichothermofontia sichuanensis TaxID=3045816 RepID=UPI0022475E44|nr:undecaprenyldiphospho-muramoylpentapeptide beta-N-acetylglucosaminyltransferase [Trichothermofontia sichuanensis]UZQ55411.1 undecaprenyldiphospho-muramoylpentapeptide beta-N-acetylglucosaminyltransferase [Trichothermofontia sichuanensis B231]